MPQFELENVGPVQYSGLMRARSAEDAIARSSQIGPEMDLEISSETDVKGWRVVMIDGAESGRVRLHQRMKFRRD